MLKRIFLLLFIITIIISCTKSNDAQDMIFDFYSQYLSPSITETERHELIKNCCTHNMLETLDILYSFDEEEGLIIGIDYDPFLNAQDFFQIKDIKIEKAGENKYGISWNNTSNTIMVNVIKDKNNWKIDSIDIDRFEQIKKDVVDYWNNKGKDIPKVFSK